MREFCGDFGVGRGCGIHGEVGFEGVEEIGFAGGFHFGGELGEGFFEGSECPAAVVDAFGGGVGSGFETEAFIGVGEVDGEGFGVAAAALGAGVAPFVDDEAFHTDQHEGAEPAFLGGDVLEHSFFEEACEEGLGEVFGFMGGVAFFAGVGVKGIPVGVAEFGECFFGRGGAGAAARTTLQCVVAKCEACVTRGLRGAGRGVTWSPHPIGRGRRLAMFDFVIGRWGHLGFLKRRIHAVNGGFCGKVTVFL